MSSKCASLQAIVCTPDFDQHVMSQSTATIQRITFIVFDRTDALLSEGHGAKLRAFACRLNPQRQLSIFASRESDAVRIIITAQHLCSLQWFLLHPVGPVKCSQ